MTRADRSKLLYFVVLLAIAGVSVIIWWYLGFKPQALIVLGLLLAIPGRIPSLFWREFYRGQQELQAGDPERAEASFQAFLGKVRSRPWLKRLIYFKWGVHTWDIEAMTLNNLGNTFVERGQPTQAARWYDEALALDPNYGVPYSNLAVVRYACGDDAAAAALLDRAHALGNRYLTTAMAKERAANLQAISDTAS